MSPRRSNATHRPSGLTSTLIQVPSLTWRSRVRSKPRLLLTSHLSEPPDCWPSRADAGIIVNDRTASTRRVFSMLFAVLRVKVVNALRDQITVPHLSRAEGSVNVGDVGLPCPLEQRQHSFGWQAA